MKLIEFIENYPGEQECINKVRQLRENQEHICPRCGHDKWYWKKDKLAHECKKCHHRQSLRSGTVMQYSKLPFRYWFIAMHLLCATKNTFSALEIQKQLGHKYYQTIWEMLHKLRDVMGKRDAKYTLQGDIEIDEGFFTSELLAEEKNQDLKRGVGSQAKIPVLVAAESIPVENPKKNQKPKQVKHIKMKVLADLKSCTIDKEVRESIRAESRVVSDGCKSHTHFKDYFLEFEGRVLKPEDIGKVLPWVHIVISNAKSRLTNVYHGVKSKFLQNYLNEFSYQFNRRSYGEGLFERLLIAITSLTPSFKHIVYVKKT